MFLYKTVTADRIKSCIGDSGRQVPSCKTICTTVRNFIHVRTMTSLHERTRTSELPLSHQLKKLMTTNQPLAGRGVKAKCNVMSDCFFSVTLKSTAERHVTHRKIDRSIYLSITLRIPRGSGIRVRLLALGRETQVILPITVEEPRRLVHHVVHVPRPFEQSAKSTKGER